MDPVPGSLVIYKTRCAAVAARTGDKLELRLPGGDGRNVRPKDVIFLHRGPVSALPPETLPDPDGAELAELMEGETLGFSEFLELAYGADTPAAAWSAWQLLARGVWFEGSPEAGVRARSREAAEAALAAERGREEQAARRAALLERIRTAALTPEDRPAMREIEHVALGEAPSSRLMRDLGIEALPEKAHQLLLRTGVWDACVDPWPARFGVECGDPDLPLPDPAEEPREDLTAMTAYAIDDAGSADPDDAIGFAEGLLWVHVADPLASIAAGDPVDLEARRRGANLYLPEGISHMLPPAATARFGLGLNEVSPALSFALSIDGEGRAKLEKLTLSRVRVTRCDYDGAGHLPEGELAPVREMLERFRRRRAGSGALFIDLPEVKIRLREGKVEITPLPLLPVRELVANAMLACGSAAAEYLAEREIAAPYSVQPPPEEPEPGIPEGLPLMFARRRGCAPGALQSFPGAHAGLGLDPYLRVTSPLRRYEDLLAHRQLRRVLAGEAPLTSDEIDAALAFSEPAAQERRKLERRVNEFWTLTWLCQHPDWSGVCVAAARQDDRLTWLIPELAYEFKNRFDDGLRLGEERRCVPVTVDPVTLTCRMRIEKLSEAAS